MLKDKVLSTIKINIFICENKMYIVVNEYFHDTVADRNDEIG